MIKTYILDTNILLQTEGKVINGFDDNVVVIPGMVLEELDSKKDAKGELGYQARECIRMITPLKDKCNGLAYGVPLDNGGIFEIETSSCQDFLPTGWKADKPDNIILGTVKWRMNKEKEKNNGNRVILITNDVSMQVKASIVGIEVQGYKNDQVASEDFYTGRETVYVPAELINVLYSCDFLEQKDVEEYLDGITLYENSFFIFKSYSNSSALAVFENGQFKLIRDEKFEDISGISPKNAGQTFSMYALLKPVDELPLVLLRGCAGCGKTLMALAAGLKQMSQGMYDKIIITRSNTLADEELGFLPGTLEEKMSPLLAPFLDNLKLLYKMMGEDEDQITYAIEDMMERGSIEIVSLAYIRGRSIPNAYIIIDETQNISITQAKTIVTRVGIGSKLVMLGDIGQIDNPKLDKKSNGLSYLSDKFHKENSKLCSMLEYSSNESVRSPISSEAIRILEG